MEDVFFALPPLWIATLPRGPGLMLGPTVRLALLFVGF